MFINVRMYTIATYVRTYMHYVCICVSDQLHAICFCYMEMYAYEIYQRSMIYSKGNKYFAYRLYLRMHTQLLVCTFVQPREFIKYFDFLIIMLLHINYIEQVSESIKYKNYSS